MVLKEIIQRFGIGIYEAITGKEHSSTPGWYDSQVMPIADIEDAWLKRNFSRRERRKIRGRLDDRSLESAAVSFTATARYAEERARECVSSMHSRHYNLLASSLLREANTYRSLILQARENAKKRSEELPQELDRRRQTCEELKDAVGL
jgi:hypothetical protein